MYLWDLNLCGPGATFRKTFSFYEVEVIEAFDLLIAFCNQTNLYLKIISDRNQNHVYIFSTKNLFVKPICLTAGDKLVCVCVCGMKAIAIQFHIRYVPAPIN